MVPIKLEILNILSLDLQVSRILERGSNESEAKARIDAQMSST